MSKPIVASLAVSLLFSAIASVRRVDALPDKRSTMPTIEISIRSLKSNIKVGDPVPIEFTIQNVGSSDYDYLDRTYDRSGRMQEYELNARTEDGKQTTDPRENSLHSIMGGLAARAVLKPHQVFHKTVFLNRWAKLDAAGTYRIVGKYHFENGSEMAESKSVSIEIGPRTAVEMNEYVQSLEQKIDLCKSQDETEQLVQELMFTMAPSTIPKLINWMYEKPRNTYWMSEALSYYLPQAAVRTAVLHACEQRGLAPGMVSVLYCLERTKGKVNPLLAKQWSVMIAKSLDVNNRNCWASGCLEAQSHPDDAHTTRLIAIAIDPDSQARVQAIYALAMNRTDDSVRALKVLLSDHDKSIQDNARSAIHTAYMYKGNEVPGRRLLESDFDSSVREPRK